MPGEDSPNPFKVPPPDLRSANVPQDDDASCRSQNREAMDRMNERNRVLMEARMLPAHAELSRDLVSEIVDHFKKYIDKHDITAAQVGREIQYAPAVISAWMKESYKGDVSAVTRAINNWMERDARRKEARRPSDYVSMWLAEDYRTYVYLADKQKKMLVLVGPSGTGKTKVIKTLCEELRGLYVCCSENMTLRGLLLALAKELDWTRDGGHRYELERYVIERLAGTERIVFIDEAHLLGPTIRSLRAIYDQAEVPIVMAGTDEIEGAVDDRAHGRGQFTSRCIFYSALDHIRTTGGGRAAPNEGKDLFTVEEIKAFFAKRKIRLNRDGLQMIWALSCLAGYGCLRLVEAVIEMAFIIDPDVQALGKSEVVAALRMVERKSYNAITISVQRQLQHWDEAPAVLAKVG